MTDFPPSDNSELPEDPERSQSTEPETPLDEVHSDSKHKEVPPTKRPFLMTEGGEHSEPPARPELFDDAAWSRMGPQTLYARLFRPLFNLVLLGVVLLPALMLIAVISIANWIAFRDRKKVFFKQYRMGYRDKPFKLWKFRTMKDSTRPNYETWTKGQEADRVTKFGSFLRRSHLDELPQLFNVLRREMNFIGPRPEMLEINDWVLSEIPLFYRRLAVRPGITGFAQITQGYVGNDIPGYQRKLEADLKYITDLSLRRDLGVLITTPFWMLRLLGWQNDPADKKDDDDSDTEGGSRMIHPTPRPGVTSNTTAQILEEIDPLPSV
ncbi:MAG: sugar transferase [Planctomycetota bacterium]|nr:sugar transferase [Planctomycetota bacterium]